MEWPLLIFFPTQVEKNKVSKSIIHRTKFQDFYKNNNTKRKHYFLWVWNIENFPETQWTVTLLTDFKHDHIKIKKINKWHHGQNENQTRSRNMKFAKLWVVLSKIFILFCLLFVYDVEGGWLHPCNHIMQQNHVILWVFFFNLDEQLYVIYGHCSYTW